MTHQMYLDFLFEDPQDLSLAQSQDLENHLENCQHCRDAADAYKGLDSLMRRSEIAAPLPGFSLRWQDRLQAQQRIAQRKQVGITIGVVFGGLLILSIFLLVLMLPLLRSPNLLVWTWIYQLFVLGSYLEVLEGFISPLLNASFTAIPLITWVFVLGLVSELAVLWVVSYRLLTNPRRITQ